MKKKIIACLDIFNGRTVKGVNFVNLIDAGDPVELAKIYVEQGADELVFLDISATVEKRKTLVGLVEKVAAQVNIPFTVGGGISEINDVETLIKAGADKISINSAAVKQPEIISEIVSKFGSSRVVIAIDAKKTEMGWEVVINGGNTLTQLETVAWALEVEKLGAGEILLTTMDRDGTKEGFAIDITAAVSRNVNIPVTASGGAGTMQHFRDVFLNTNCNAALAAGVFHSGLIDIQQLKSYLKNENITVYEK
jgi:cyclase